MRRKKKQLGEAEAKLTDKFEWYVHLPKNPVKIMKKILKASHTK